MPAAPSTGRTPLRADARAAVCHAPRGAKRQETRLHAGAERAASVSRPTSGLPDPGRPPPRSTRTSTPPRVPCTPRPCEPRADARLERPPRTLSSTFAPPRSRGSAPHALTACGTRPSRVLAGFGQAGAPSRTSTGSMQACRIDVPIWSAFRPVLDAARLERCGVACRPSPGGSRPAPSPLVLD